MSAPQLIFDTIVEVDLSRRPFVCIGDSGDRYVGRDDRSLRPAHRRAGSASRPRRRSAAAAFRPARPATASSSAARKWSWSAAATPRSRRRSISPTTPRRSRWSIAATRFRAEKILQDRLFRNPKITVVWDSVVEEILGEPSRRRWSRGCGCATSRPAPTATLPTDGVFIAIGHTPTTELFKGKLAMDSEGYILTKPDSTATDIQGVFAAGDVQDKIFRQAVTAAGTGCMAALEAEKCLARAGGRRMRRTPRNSEAGERRTGPRGQTMAMDWDKLRIFHAVAEAGSFTHAGEALNLSQSAISRQIGALEEQPRRAAVPPPCARPDPDRAGRAALSHRARRVRQAQHGRGADLRESRTSRTGPLKVTTTVGFGSTWLTPRMHEFLDLYPEIDVSLVRRRQRARSRHARGRCRHPHDRRRASPDLMQRHLLTRRSPRLRLAQLHQEVRQAADAPRISTSTG